MRKKSLHLWISRRMHRLNGSDLFLAFAKISLFFLSFSSGAQRLVLAYTIYTKPQRSVALFFFWLVLDRKRSQRTARLVVACKTCPIKCLCKIKSYALKEAIGITTSEGVIQLRTSRNVVGPETRSMTGKLGPRVWLASL